MNDLSLKQKLCKYLYTTYRDKYKSNLDFALSCGVDEKTIRLIQQGNYNMSIELFEKICISQQIKPSEVFLSIGE